VSGSRRFARLWTVPFDSSLPDMFAELIDGSSDFLAMQIIN